ncbi:MAG: hypothetical protein GC149_20400 [Gammaproteobacteria bacterium]|nr:hypothetical protein [Gammaproteobacteria bacterium]
MTSSGTTARNGTAFGDATRIISVYATEDVYIEFGGSGVEATSSNHFFPKGIYYDFHIPPGVTHAAVLQVSTGGTVYISEKQ